VEPSSGDAPASVAPTPSAPPPFVERERLLAAFEVLLCSGIPTQVVIAQVLALAGFDPCLGGTPQPRPLFLLALLDSIALVSLIVLLMLARGENIRAAFLGHRPAPREALLGIVMVPLLFVGVGVTVLLIRAALPWLHNVAENPFERMFRTPGDAILFAVVAIVAGGVREEIQRAFLLRRFEEYLGGPVTGLIVVSVAFGAGHFVQGWDAAIATALLGFTWGMLYLRRRSIVAPVVSHAGYNALQIVQVMVVRELAL
jgi:membrane protease YdiL (CAAX protease family)